MYILAFNKEGIIYEYTPEDFDVIGVYRFRDRVIVEKVLLDGMIMTLIVKKLQNLI